MNTKNHLMCATVIGVDMDDKGRVEGLLLSTPDGNQFTVMNGDEWRGTLEVKPAGGAMTRADREAAKI